MAAIALAVTLSRFFPVVSFVEALQERVMSWGAWAGVCYPLLFAACNILLLPGGVLAVGGGFFFGLWWGFLIVFAGNIVSTAISFSLSRFVARRWFRRKLSANPTLRALGPDANSVSHLHALGLDRSYAWPFLLRIHGNAGAACSAHHARQKLPANT